EASQSREQVEPRRRQLGEQRSCRFETDPEVRRATATRGPDLLRRRTEHRAPARHLDDRLHGHLQRSTSERNASRTASVYCILAIYWPEVHVEAMSRLSG